MKNSQRRKIIGKDELIEKESVLKEVSRGEIIGQHRNVINVRFNSGSGISLTSSRVKIAPYHIQIETFPAELNLQGKSIIISEGKIILPDDSKIYLQQGKISKSKLTDKNEFPDERTAQQRLAANLKFIQNKLSQEQNIDSIHSVENTVYSSGNKIFNSIDRYLRSLMSLLKQTDCWQKRNNILKKFIGAGKGLTPGGDDFLVGFLSFLHFYKEQLTDKVDLGLNEKTESATTFVSFMALSAAVKGHFNREILNFYKFLTETEDELSLRLEDLLKIGSSSGRDIMTGILFAARFLTEPRLLE